MLSVASTLFFTQVEALGDAWLQTHKNRVLSTRKIMLKFPVIKNISEILRTMKGRVAARASFKAPDTLVHYDPPHLSIRNIINQSEEASWRIERKWKKLFWPVQANKCNDSLRRRVCNALRCSRVSCSHSDYKINLL